MRQPERFLNSRYGHPPSDARTKLSVVWICLLDFHLRLSASSADKTLPRPISYEVGSSAAYTLRRLDLPVSISIGVNLRHLWMHCNASPCFWPPELTVAPCTRARALRQTRRPKGQSSRTPKMRRAKPNLMRTRSLFKIKRPMQLRRIRALARDLTSRPVGAVALNRPHNACGCSSM